MTQKEADKISENGTGSGVKFASVAEQLTATD